MTRSEYVELLADLLSGDAQRISKANQRLYEMLIGDSDSHPAMALVDAEEQLHG